MQEEKGSGGKYKKICPVINELERKEERQKSLKKNEKKCGKEARDAESHQQKIRKESKPKEGEHEIGESSNAQVSFTI